MNCAAARARTFSPALRPMRLIVTRPVAEAEILARQLRVMGHQVLIEPMLRIQNIADAPLDLTDAAALLFTSANGVRAFAAHTSQRDLPVMAVGAATAEVARDAGFSDVATAGGDVVALANLVREQLKPTDGVLVHVAGSAVAGDLAGDLGQSGDGGSYTVRRAMLYRAEVVTQLSQRCRAALEAGEIDGILFFSPRSAATFVKLLHGDNLGGICRDIDLYGLSKAVADAARDAAGDVPWRRLKIAAMPRQDDLLALL